MKTLIDLYKIYSPSRGEKRMKKFIRRWVRRNIPEAILESDQKGNIYVTKGESETYPCVVSHIDQVQHTHSKDFEVYQVANTLVGYSQKNKRFEGLGADDKNGIWVCLNCLLDFDVIKCAFFVEEEIGCGGSRAANFEWFGDCRFVLQCDRRNGSDLITKIGWEDLCSQDFLNAIGYEQFGYRPTTGMMTDVETLKDNGVELSMLNISCGYYEPHTDNEFTVIDELENCLNFVEHIIETCTDVYPHKTEEEEYDWRSWYKANNGLDDDFCDYGYHDDWYGGGNRNGFVSVGDVIKETQDAQMQSHMEEYNEIYDSVWYMIWENNLLTASDIYNSYKDSFKYLTYEDIEFMVDEIKEQLNINVF